MAQRIGVEVIRERVERIDTAIFSALEENDILFINSRHTVRPQGDVLHEFLGILPLLSPGVIVHVHDVFTPQDYPLDWIVNLRRMWDEQSHILGIISKFQFRVRSQFWRSTGSITIIVIDWGRQGARSSASVRKGAGILLVQAPTDVRATRRSAAAAMKPTSKGPADAAPTMALIGACFYLRPARFAARADALVRAMSPHGRAASRQYVAMRDFAGALGSRNNGETWLTGARPSPGYLRLCARAGWGPGGGPVSFLQ